MKLEAVMDGHDPAYLRGSPMNGERYYAKEFADREWRHMWKKVWHIAGRENELEEPGDYLVHDFLHREFRTPVPAHNSPGRIQYLATAGPL